MNKMEATIMALFIGAVTAFGADYSGMSTDELLSLRGTPKTQQERQALHNELQSRYQHMTQEQQQEFNNRPGKGMGPGQGMGPGNGMGAGQGMGPGKGKGGM